MKIKESYQEGIRKATLERMSQFKGHLSGTSPEFFRERLIPYAIKSYQARKILPPKNLLGKLVFSLGYWSYQE